MAKVYLRRFQLVGEEAEINFFAELRRTCYQNFYPYNLFPDKGLEEVELEPLTIFYGGNGSGKTTLLNLIAEKTGVKRYARFNSSAFFESYAAACQMEGEAPFGSEILTSDDVFDEVLGLRSLNAGIDRRREELFDEFVSRKKSDCQLHSMADFEEFRETWAAKRQTQSRFVRERMAENTPMHSNGESAMSYFERHITENALFLLDEPENSLSIDRQEALARFLADSVRFYGCQIIMATHSPVLLAIPHAKIYDLDQAPAVPRKWTELENVRRYFEFFEAHREEFQ